jgi:hypothetical protein
MLMKTKENLAKIAVLGLLALMVGCGSDANEVGEDAGLTDQHDAAQDTDPTTSDGTSDDTNAGNDAGDTGPPDNYECFSGEIDEIRQGDALGVDDARREAARTAYEQLNKAELVEGFSPEALYGTFNEFALTHFGPVNQPLLHKYTCDVLDFVTAGEWRHVSTNSATIAFETSLPVRGTIEYGTSAEDLSESTAESERYYFTQIHHLSGLEPETTYYYRRVGLDETGKTIVSKVRDFTTSDMSGVVEVPGDLDGPHYVLDQPDTTYLLTEDIVADGTAIEIAAGGVTVDLNGHRVVYANAAVTDRDNSDVEKAGTGIWANSSTDLHDIHILNGTIAEGDFIGNAGVHAVSLYEVENIEMAGVSIYYHAAQVYAVYLGRTKGRMHVHHNHFVDRGFEIRDRHGSGGGRPIQISDSSAQSKSANDYELDHNLVKRTRQNGLRQANSMHDNEIYVDSWSTNSFAIQPHSKPDTPAGDIHGNKLFLTGYNAFGMGWAHLDLSVVNNLVQMEGVSTNQRRNFEGWGEQDAIAAFRITNYGDGGQVRDNLSYTDNVIVGRARSGGLMRGTQLYSDRSITNTHFDHNYVDIRAVDDQTLDVTPVVAQGNSNGRPDHNPTFYIDDRLVSNIANVRFGDSYGRGDRHTFINTTFEKVGDSPDYHTFVFDGAYHTRDHEIIDPIFEGGAAADDVWWRRVSIRAYYTVKWTVELSGKPGASATINDVDGDEVFSGELDEDGKLDVALAQMTIRPTEWSDDGSGGGVDDEFNHQKVMHTPHTVTVDGAEQSVTADALGKTLDF